MYFSFYDEENYDLSQMEEAKEISEEIRARGGTVVEFDILSTEYLIVLNDSDPEMYRQCGGEVLDGVSYLVLRDTKEREYLAAESDKKSITSVSEPLTEPPVEPVRVSDLIVDRYKPQHSYEVIGNASVVRSLKRWLSAPSRDKAYMLVGQSGVGKTTMAQIVAKECGYELLECNSSDTRSKESVTEFLRNVGVSRQFNDAGVLIPNKICTLFDECDGMSGGGVGVLCGYIKKGKFPVICICNDKFASSLKPLKTLCTIAHVFRPSIHEIRSRVQQIVEKENITSLKNKTHLDRILVAGNGDVRATMNMLQLNKLGDGNSIIETQTDGDMSTFDCTKRLFRATLSLQEKEDTYWKNGDMTSLFIQENYPCASSVLEKLADAADSISVGDTMDTLIRSEQAWQLGSHHAFASSIAPATLLKTKRSINVQFPALLGKQSSGKKTERLRKQIQRKLGFPDLDLAKDTLVPMDTEGFERTMELMAEYELDKDDLDFIDSQGMKGASLKGKPKASFTRSWNKKYKKK